MGFGDMTRLETFWDNHSLTSSEESRTNGNHLDLETYGDTDVQIDNLFWNTQITEDFVDGVGMYLKLITSDSATFATGVEVIAAIGDAADPFAAADWPAGKKWSLKIATRKLKKYVEVEFVETTGASAGKVTSGLGVSAFAERPTQRGPT